MKLLDRSLLWALSVLAAAFSILLILLVLFPSLGWLRLSAVRIAVGVLAALCLVLAVGIHFRQAFGRRSKDAALVSDGADGSAYVTLSVLGDMARRIVMDTGSVRSCRCVVKNSGSGVDVELEAALRPGVAVAPLALLIQERLKERIYEMTGIRVEKVRILVEAAEEGEPSVAALPPGRVK